MNLHPAKFTHWVVYKREVTFDFLFVLLQFSNRLYHNKIGKGVFLLIRKSKEKTVTVLPLVSVLFTETKKINIVFDPVVLPF